MNNKPPNVSNEEIVDVRKFAVSFVNMTDALVDNPETPVHVRWEYVLKHLPETRRKYIYEDMEQALQRAYNSTDNSVVAAGVELARLRYYFFKVLYEKGHAQAHQNAWQVINCEKWIMKLADHFNTVQPAKFKNNKWTKPEHKKATHQWLN